VNFFDAFQKTIIDYGILDDDIYNFDETGFAMGIIATARVVTKSENIRTRKTATIRRPRPLMNVSL
jgi:hypothetical protein